MRWICLFLFALALTAQSPGVEIVRYGGAFRLSGPIVPGTAPAEGWQSVFAIYTQAGDVPPVLGRYRLEAGALVFEPLFPIAPGTPVTAIFKTASGARVVHQFPPQPDAIPPSTYVEALYPTAGTLPANQLKLYLRFSAPMSQGEAWQSLQLLDDSGRVVELPFLEIDQELWDRDYRRLTLLFDPGRIKRGVLPREEAGPSLIEGRRYTLVVAQSWRDAQGRPLAREYRKTFSVGPEDRTAVDPESWELTIPNPASREPLAVDFGEPLDRALLERLITVESGGNSFPGEVTLPEGETRWLFRPDREWRAGGYNLRIGTGLEDLAGNRVHRPFEVDSFDRISRTPEAATVTLPFRIGSE